MFAFVTHVGTAQCRDRITPAMKHGKGENPLDTTIGGPAGELIVSLVLACTLPYTITTRTPYLPVRTYNISIQFLSRMYTGCCREFRSLIARQLIWKKFHGEWISRVPRKFLYIF